MNAPPPNPKPESPPNDPPLSPRPQLGNMQALWLKRSDQVAFSSLWLLVIAGCLWYFFSERGFDTIDIDQREVETVEFRVEINSASVREFSCLPGIGPKTAAKIVEWRSENGPFESAESLTDVPGISARMFKALGPWLDCEATRLFQEENEISHD